MTKRRMFEGHLWLAGLTPADGGQLAERVPYPVTTIGGALETLNGRYNALVVVWETLDGVYHVQVYPRRTVGKLHLDVAISLSGTNLFNILRHGCLMAYRLKETRCTPLLSATEKVWGVP